MLQPGPFYPTCPVLALRPSGVCANLIRRIISWGLLPLFHQVQADLIICLPDDQGWAHRVEGFFEEALKRAKGRPQEAPLSLLRQMLNPLYPTLLMMLIH
eukprot:1153278-Pelagomonas_calceolata.AAC.3